MEPGKVYRLRGVVQHYAWGGFDYIPDVLGLKNTEGKPFAELWLGAHAVAPSIVHVDDEEKPLDEFLRVYSNSALGQKVISRFGEDLPFLFKVLDVRDMLSIQVHPSKEQAEEGFARENKKRIKLDAPNRNYTDNNHKPEVHVALTEFWLLHGFRPVKEIEQTLKNISEFRFLLSVFYADGLVGLYTYIMKMPQEQVDDVLNALLKRLAVEEPEDMDHPDYWALKALHTFSQPDGHLDRGIFSIYLLNVLHLQPGESTFQDAGVPHAYLYGTTVELMANSDNVLRGGLTPKYVDVDDLLQTVKFEGGRPEVLIGEVISYAERVYHTPAADFELSKLTLYAGETFDNADKTPEILLLLNGKISVMCGWDEEIFARGESWFSPTSTSCKVTALEDATLFRAKVPF